MIGRILVAVAACAALSIGIARADQHEQDAAMGKSVYDDLAKRDQIVGNSPYDRVLQRVGGKVAAAAGRQWYVERFYIIRGNQMNAFSAPGGYVFVNEGLLRNVDNVDELANVLGHETAHLALGHVTSREQQQQHKNMFFSLSHSIAKTFSPNSDKAVSQAETAGNYTFLGFSREQEYQADQYGATYAARAGFNPWGSIWFFNETEAMYGDAGFEQYVQQHPSTKDRISRLESYFKAHPREFGHWPAQLTSRGGLPMS